MRKIVLISVVVGIAMFVAGYATSNATRGGSLQSELATAHRHVSVLERDLIQEQVSLFVTLRAAEEQGTRRLAALRSLTGDLRREQSIVVSETSAKPAPSR